MDWLAQLAIILGPTVLVVILTGQAPRHARREAERTFEDTPTSTPPA